MGFYLYIKYHRKETAMKKFRVSKLILIFVIIATIIIGSSSISFATTVSKVNYLGSGKVEVSFANKTSYKKSVKVKAKDNKGKTYQVKISNKKDKKLKFKIYGFKAGRSYKLTISGLKDGSVSTSFKTISKNKAISTAKKKAKKLGATSFTDVSGEGTTYRGIGAWRISFESNGSSYMYLISQQSGMVLGGGKK